MNPFGDVKYVPGLGMVEAVKPAPTGKLGDDATVMMISGLGQDQVTKPAETPTEALTDTIPWWGWFLLGVAATLVVLKLLGKMKE